jgi:hypothetical protein
MRRLTTPTVRLTKDVHAVANSDPAAVQRQQYAAAFHTFPREDPITKEPRFYTNALQTMRSEQFIVQLVDEIAEKAAQQHLSRHYDKLAVNYTAQCLWAEMMAVVQNSLLTEDPGNARDVPPSKNLQKQQKYATAQLSLGSTVTLASTATVKPASTAHQASASSVANHIRHHDASSASWQAGDPPARVDLEGHARRAILCKKKPNQTSDDNATMLSTKSIRSKPATRHSRSTAATGNSRPGSGSQVSSNGDTKRNNNNTFKRSPSMSNGSPILVPGANSKSGTQGAFKSVGSVRTKKSDNSSPLSTAVQPVETLQQPEPSAALEEAENQAHLAEVQLQQQVQQENTKKAAKVDKQLLDPKVSSKPFTIDVTGQIIPVTHLDETSIALANASRSFGGMAANPLENAAPIPPPSKYNVLSDSVPGSQDPSPMNQRRASTIPRKSQAPKRDDVFCTSDSRDVPMQVSIAPVGGVTLKDPNSGPRRGELKLPATKMSKQEYNKLTAKLNELPVVPVDTAFSDETKVTPSKEPLQPVAPSNPPAPSVRRASIGKQEHERKKSVTPSATDQQQATAKPPQQPLAQQNLSKTVPPQLRPQPPPQLASCEPENSPQRSRQRDRRHHTVTSAMHDNIKKQAAQWNEIREHRRQSKEKTKKGGFVLHVSDEGDDSFFGDRLF